MNRKQVIEMLEMENDLICFNPLTGEEIQLECLSDLNRGCYDAHQEAIRIINNSIDIDYIKNIINANKYLWEQHKNRMFVDEGVVKIVNYSLTAQILSELIERWEKENET